MAKLTRPESVQKPVTYGFVCDHCGKKAEHLDRTYPGDGVKPNGWHSFASYHGDWGNDSIESHEDWDVCSWGCYVAIVRKIVKDYGEPPVHGGGRVGPPRRISPTLTVDGRDWFLLRDMLEYQPEPAQT